MTLPVVPLEVHIVDRRTGVWCDPCALPSVIEVDAALVSGTDLEVITRSTVWSCTDCGAYGVRPRGDTTP